VYMHNTYVLVSRFTHYYRVTCDLMSNLFLSYVFYWLILSYMDCHINHDWLHVVERF
jgi:hypothetical protein